MPVTIIDSDAFPATLTAPAAGDPASAPTLVSQFLQGIANRSRYLYNRILPLVTGGTIIPTGVLNFVTGTGAQVTVNDLHCAAIADGGLVTAYGANGLSVPYGNLELDAGSVIVAGAVSAGGLVTASAGVRGPRRMLTVSPVTGTTSFSPVNYDIIITKTAVPSGTNWRLDNTGVNVGESLLIANLDATHAQPILIQDSGGTTIQAVIGAAGQPFVFMAVFLGGTAWQMIPITYHP